jgi:uncharacterized protein
VTATPGLRVGVADLLAHPGSRRAVRVAVALPGIAISTAAVPPDEPIEVELELESILPPGVTATGRVRAPWTGSCRRCLEPVTGVVEARVREVFERHPVEGETYRLVGDEVDLEPLVRDAVLLSLPLAPLCSEACRGPAPDLFPARVADDSDAGQVDRDDAAPAPVHDPRWAALDELRFD